MDNKYAVNVLLAHNEWRRGNKKESWEPMPHSPSEIGLAIATVCDALERAEAELAKYRSAPTFVLIEGNNVSWPYGFPVDAGRYELIIRPEAP